VTGAFSRNKGARAEREFCKLAAEALGGKFNRNLQQWAEAQLGDIAQPVGPYLVECKSCAVLREKEWWQQACVSAQKAGLLPALAIKLNRKGWRVVVPMQEAWATGQQWGKDVRYTETLYLEGFWLRVREG
jgi:Holliday junction resolvase